MTSVFFALGRYFLLEYIYHDQVTPEILDTAQVKFRRVTNEHTGNPTYVNDNDSKRITGNISDTTVVELDDGRFALLDNDAAFFYPNVDDKVDIEDVVISPNLLVTYDTVRVHFISGYNFPDNDGFQIRLDLRSITDSPILLMNQAYLKSDSSSLIFAPTPRKFSEFIYDRYIQFKVPSLKYILDQQNANPGSNNTLAAYLSEGAGLADSNQFYVDFRIIRRAVDDEGVTYLFTDSQSRFAVSSTDDFQNLVPHIQLAEDGDYFEYFGTWNGGSMEDFIFGLNALAGNDYVLFHDLRLFEQIGQTFDETDTITTVQTGNYGIPKKYVPVLENGNVAVSFSIEYTLRLFNRADGRSIFKTSSVTSFDVSKFGKRRITIDAGDNTLPIKVYNRIVSSDQKEIRDLGSQTVKTKYVPVYIETDSVLVQTDESQDNVAFNRNDVNITLYPFDNTFRFNIIKLLDGQISAIDLGANTHFLNFMNGDAKVRVEEIENNRNKQNGELIFKVPNDIAQTVIKFQDRKFYVTSINSDGEESSVLSGQFINGNSIEASGEKININEVVEQPTEQTVEDDTSEIVDTDQVVSASESVSRLKDRVSRTVTSRTEDIRRRNIINSIPNDT